jgi:hypothetical protein
LKKHWVIIWDGRFTTTNNLKCKMKNAKFLHFKKYF